MAYRLTSGGTAAKYVTIPTCSLAGDFDITLVATQDGQTNGTFLFAGTGVAGQNGLDLYRNQSGKYQIFIDNTSSIAGTINASNNLATPDTIRVSRVSGVVTLRVNGVVDGTTSNSNTLRIDRFFHRAAWAFYGNMAFYTMSITAASGNRFYDASASGGTGTSLPDTVSNKNGTLVGFSVPADWVFYSSGGVITATSSFTMPQMAAAIASTVTAPVYSADVSVTMPQMTVSASSAVDAPAFTASALFSMPQVHVSASGNVSSPGFVSSVDFTMPQMAVAIDAASTVPTYEAELNVTMPQMSVSAAADVAISGISGSVAFSMPQFTVNASGSVAAPALSASISFSMPQMVVQVSTFEADYYAVENIDIPAASTGIELIAASRHIEYTNQSSHLEWRA